jgi:hypothetical protein
VHVSVALFVFFGCRPEDKALRGLDLKRERVRRKKRLGLLA